MQQKSKTMKVYIVEYGFYDDELIYGVFSSEILAQIFIDTYDWNKDGRKSENVVIIECEMDKPIIY
jgi:hypothetical protein